MCRVDFDILAWKITIKQIVSIEAFVLCLNYYTMSMQATASGEQGTGSSAHGTGAGMSGMRAGMSSAGFTSTPINVSLPPEVANMLPGFMNMAAQFGQNVQDGHQENSGSQEHGSINEDGEPEISVNGNINMTFEGGEMPDQVAGFMQSMLQMFSGAHNQQGTAQGGPPRDPPSS